MISNLHFLKVREEEISGTISLTLYLGKEGEKLPATPALVGEHMDVYHRVAGGGWRFQSRRFQIAFSSLGELPLSNIGPAD